VLYPCPAKGVGRETGARVQISQSAPNIIKPHEIAVSWGFFILRIFETVLYYFEKFSAITVLVTVSIMPND
jgi:hypothetical protein